MIDLFAWLCSPFFGLKEKINSQEPNPRHIMLGAGYFLFLILIAASVIALLLSAKSYIASPPEEGKTANEYVYIDTETKHGSVAICPEGSDDCSSTQTSSDKNKTPEQNFNEYSKNKRDINAQEGMWRAANLLVVLTLVQVFVGAFTVYFLIKTFRTQKRELNAANRTAEAAESAERAQMLASFVTELNDQGNGHGELIIRFENRNAGNTFAIIKSFRIDWLKHETEGFETHIFHSPEDVSVSTPTIAAGNDMLGQLQMTRMTIRGAGEYLSFGIWENHIRSGRPEERIYRELALPDRMCRAVCSWTYADIHQREIALSTTTEFKISKIQTIKSWSGNKPDYQTILNPIAPAEQVTEITEFTIDGKSVI